MIRLIIANPYAGNKRGSKYAKTMEKVFDNLKKEGNCQNDNIFIELTEYIGHATEIVLEYSIMYRHDTVIVYCIGGDGTVSEVATAINGKANMSMVVIPKGTGNDFSKAINTYSSIRKLVKTSLTKTPEKVDCIEVKNKVVTNMINTGIDAAIVANLRYFRKIPFISGKMKYKLSILYTIFIPKIYNMKIRVDDKIYKGKYTLVAIGNNKYCGGGVNILPDANIQDGMLDVCIVKNTTLLQKIMYLPKITKGKHENLAIVKILRGKNISVVSNRKLPVSFDGEVQYIKGFRAKVSEKSLNVIKTLDK